MGEELNKVKDVAKKVLKLIGRKYLIIFLIILLIILILAASVYIITLDDATNDDEEWSNPRYGASQYTEGVTMNEDGTLNSSMTAKELWDKMIKNGSDIEKYLDTPQDLLDLMNAENVTQFLDTRPNPDEPINWDEVNDINSTKIQGLVKLKRADTNGSTYTLTYVDEETFQSYINEYNSSGSETAKNNALKHFTLGRTVATASTAKAGIIKGTGNFTKYDDLTEEQIKAIANLCKQEQGTLKGAAAEASLIANRFELYGSSFGTGSTGLYNYVRNSGWFANAASHMDSGSATAEYIEVVKGVLVNGKRTLPGYVDEHVTLGTKWITSATNDGASINVMDRSAYVKNKTIIQQSSAVGSGKFTFYCFPDTNSDPFGYISEDNRSKIGDAYYDYDSGELKNGSGDDSSGDDSGDSGDTKTNENGEQVVDVSQAIVNAAKTTPSAGAGYCLRWVSNVYANAGLSGAPGACARESYEKSVVSNSRDNIPIGAAVYGSGSGRGNYGHVGIYIGNNMVMDCISDTSINTCTLDEWIAWQERKSGITLSTGEHVKGYLGWGWPDAVQRTPSEGSIDSSNSINKTRYYAKVATWTETREMAESDDPEGENFDNTSYRMTTTNVNYQALVKGFTMPFDYLWAFLVTGEEKEFVLELADLVYDSDIHITVHDNLNTNTNVNVYTYTKKIKTETKATATIKYKDGDSTKSASKTGNWTDEDSNNYTTKYTTITKTNTLNVGVTLADVWMAKFTQSYTREVAAENVTTTSNTLEDIPYQESENSPTNEDTKGHGSALLSELKDSYSSYDITSQSKTVEAKIYNSLINRKQEVTNTSQDTRYVSSPKVVEEKTDRNSSEPNFVTLFVDWKHAEMRSNIMSVESWLFEILETNESTSEMVDLTKYLLYKATGNDYGVTEYDFGAIWKSVYQGMVTMGDLVVHTEMAEEKFVITDESALEEAIMQVYSGKTQTNLLSVLNNGTFMKLQEDYKVNAVFAIAVTIIESGGGTAWSAISPSTYNWMSMTGSYQGKTYKNPNSSNPRTWRVYPSFDAATLDFGDQIANNPYYFKMDRYTVKQIAPTYCDVRWGEAVVSEMTKIYNAMGVTVDEFSTVGPAQLGEAARIKGQEERIAWLYDGQGLPTSKAVNDQYLETFPVEILNSSGSRQTMNVTMHKKLKTEVQAIFKEMADAGFKIVGGDISYRTWGSDAGFKGRFPQSAHTYGHAFDVNPVQNYCIYANGQIVGDHYSPGTDPLSVTEPIINIWKQHGFYWGGDWTSLKDYMHFSYFNH